MAAATVPRISSEGAVNWLRSEFTAGSYPLYWDEFKQIPSAFPPTNEQKTIADFLDTHAAMTRQLVRAKRRLIALLNEQKQAIIHEAVTRGLDANVRLKPSGIDWLGDVPEHWGKVRLGSRIQIVNGYPFDSMRFSHTTGEPLVRLRNIFCDKTEVRYDGVDVSEASIDFGDVLVGMDGDFNVAIWQGGPAFLNQRVCCLRPAWFNPPRVCGLSASASFEVDQRSDLLDYCQASLVLRYPATTTLLARYTRTTRDRQFDH